MPAIDPLYLFVFLGLFSPGPNVILLTASGARFGFRATVPHVLGVVAGVGVTSGLTGLGVGALLQSAPALQMVLKVLAAAWILWMAYRLYSSTKRPKVEARGRPFTFVEAVLFQWVNPKVWAVAVAATGFTAALPPAQQAVKLALTFSGLNLFVCLFWSFAGSLLAYLLSHPRAWAVFMRVMAAALAVTAFMVFL